MRQIKFRAWTGSRMIVPEDKCYYQHYLSFCGCIVQRSSEGMSCFGGGDNWYVVNDLNLMQFTGLLDANGVEIYEGDVVESEIFSCKFSVVFDSKISSFILKAVSDGCNGGFAGFSQYESKNFTIIGNIHQNPELLK